MRISRIFALSTLLLLVGPFAQGGVEASAGDSSALKQLVDEGVSVLSEYLSIDTSNPPGREIEGVQFLARRLSDAGIPSRILESAPGRASLYARLQGRDRKPPILLLQHVDVVPSDEGQWANAPFGGEIRDGAIWGRGALDMKGLGVVHLMNFIALSRGEEPLERDVILLATADEEAGSYLGLTWLLDNHPELVEDVGLVLTEGGQNLVKGGNIAYVGIEEHQKIPLWVRLIVRGPAGHGSTPNRQDYASARLVRALTRILDYESPYRVESEVALYFQNVAFLQPHELRPFFLHPLEYVERKEVPAGLNPAHRALLRNTITLTGLEAGASINVIPPLALAELDCRLLPGQNPDQFLAKLGKLVGDPAVQLEVLLRGSPTDSPTHEEFFRAVTEVSETLFPEVQVGPSVLTGFTDSRQFRERGIPAFGFSPFSDSGLAGVHAANERIEVKNFKSGMEFFHRVLSRLVFE